MYFCLCDYTGEETLKKAPAINTTFLFCLPCVRPCISVTNIESVVICDACGP